VPGADVDASGPAGSTASVGAVLGWLSLDEARVHLGAAAEVLNGWYARQIAKERCYVGGGHDTVRLIDAATRELYRVRACLVEEIRADADEWAARVDRMIAVLRARRAGDGVASWDGGVA
jgi:hypothetical protein